MVADGGRSIASTSHFFVDGVPAMRPGNCYLLEAAAAK